ncbi:hypothetical protein ACSBR1_028471 [Camellia fascicularis]
MVPNQPKNNSNLSSITTVFNPSIWLFRFIPSFLSQTKEAFVEKVDKNEKFIDVVDCEEKKEDDWLPPPPKVSADTLKLGEDSTIKELSGSGELVEVGYWDLRGENRSLAFKLKFMKPGLKPDSFQTDGNNIRSVYPEGTHLMIPWFERPIVDDVRARPNESSSGSRDLQMVSCKDHIAGE